MWTLSKDIRYSLKKVIPSQKATELDEGWKRADLHVHTSCSYDVPGGKSVHPEVLFNRAVSRGMDYITFTDHDTVEAFDILGWKRDMLVPGVELSVTDLENVGHTIHVNVFELDKVQFREMKSIVTKNHDIFMLIDYLKEQDLPYMYNHPFWFAVGEKPNLFAVPEIARHFPIIEYNMQDLKQKNLFAMSLAHSLGKGMVVTTDSHTGSIGSVYTMAEGDTFREYFTNISKGNYYLVMDDPVWKHITKELAAWVELVFSMNQQEGNEFFTGVRSLDKIINFISTGKITCYPHLNYLTMRFIQKFSMSGIPVLLYILSNRSLVSDIENVMSFYF